MNIGGVTGHVVQLAKMFNNSQYETFIISGRIEENESDMTYIDDSSNVKPIYIDNMSRSIRPLQDFLTFFQMIRIIRKLKPDIVHTHTAKAGFSRFAAWLCGVPIIIHTFHGNNFKGYFSRLMTYVSISIEKCLALISDSIITISNQQRQDLLDHHITDDKKICIVPLGFDISGNQLSNKNSFRIKYDIDQNQHIIAFIGRLTAIKNPWLFLTIAKELIRKRTDVTFCIIGDGEMRPELELDIQKAQLSDRILFTGFIQDMNPVYAALDILMLTSINEGTPVTIIEAMANRKIVISSAVGGVVDLVENGVNGFTCDMDDTDCFINLTNFVLDNPKKCETMSEKAHQKIVAEYSSDCLQLNLISLYSQLVQKKIRNFELIK